MKITSVTIEGMHNVYKPVTYELKDFNYLIGRNGSGKSTVLQALQLAILGYIPGTAKTNTAIMEHANGLLMRVRVVFDDDTFIERMWATNGKTINAESKLPNGYDPKSALGELELPIFNFSEFLGLTANKAKDWFMSFLPGINSQIDWTEQLTDAVVDKQLIDTDLISNTVAELSQISGEDTIDMIRKCNEALKADLSFSKGELQKIQGTIQSLIYYDDVNCGDPDTEMAKILEELGTISEAERRLHAHQSAIDSNARINSLLQTLSDISGDCPESNPNYIELVNQKASLLSTLNSLTVNPEDISVPNTSEADEKIKELREEYATLSASVKNNEKVINGKGICPYTSQSCTSIKEMIDKLSAESSEAEKRMKAITEEVKKVTEERDAIIAEANEAESTRRAKIRDCELKLSSVEGQIRSIEKDYSTRDSYLSQLVEVPSVEGLMTFEEYGFRKDQLIEKSNKLAANKKYNELIETLTSDKYKIEDTIEAYKIWIKLTGENGLQTTLMEAPFTDFESSMNTFIHEAFGDSVECKFNLSTKANSFSYGILRNHQFIPYNLLSSGEKAMYAFALMRCLISRYDSNLKLLVVDDVSDHLDKTNLKSTFESLHNTEGMQIILAGVNEMDNMPCNLIQVE